MFGIDSMMVGPWQDEAARVATFRKPNLLPMKLEAMTALFLATDEAPFINAACITIDGGRSVLYHD